MAINSWDIREREKQYYEQGINEKEIARVFDEWKRYYLYGTRKSFANTRDCLYVNSSDNLWSLKNNLCLEDKSVLTVAGSGEFAQIFIDQGCKNIEIVDISSPGLLFAELKIIAAANLDYEEYLRLFFIPEIYSCFYRGSVLQFSIYKKIRELLSNQCIVFFDSFLNEANKDYLSVVAPWKPSARIIRFRPNFTSSDKPRIPFLFSKQHFESFQNRLKMCYWQLSYSNLTEKLLPGSVDYVYISNSGYQDKLQDIIISSLIESGAQKIGFTLRTQYSSSQVMDENGCVYSSVVQAPNDCPVANIFLNRIQLNSRSKVRIEYLVLGQYITLGRVRARVVAVSVGDDFPVYCEVEKQP